MEDTEDTENTDKEENGVHPHLNRHLMSILLSNFSIILMRQQTSIPIVMGELFNNPNEYVNLIKDRLIDFIRVHISQNVMTCRRCFLFFFD